MEAQRVPTQEKHQINSIHELCQVVTLENWQDFMLDLTYFLRAAAEFKEQHPEAQVNFKSYQWTDDGNPGFTGIILDNGDELTMEN